MEGTQCKKKHREEIRELHGDPSARKVRHGDCKGSLYNSAQERTNGAIDDVRKAIQDIVVPDLKALQAEVREGFASVEKQFAAVREGFASIEKLAAIRHDLPLAELRNVQLVAEARHEAVLKALDIDKRLE